MAVSESSLSTGGDSLRSLSQRHPTSDPPAAESAFDTALPPISSRNASPGARPQHRSQTSVIIRPRGNERPSFQNTDSISNMVARNPQMHRRNGSTLKTVMRRIFSRKSRSNTNDLESSTEDSLRNRALRSGTGSEPNSFVAISNSLNSKRTSPRPKGNTRPPIPEYIDRLSPMPPQRRRRATLPSLILSEDDREALESVASPNRSQFGSVLSPNRNSPQDNLKRQMLRAKRGSRSATSLRRLAREHRMSPIQWRRPSTEINNWGSALRAASDSELSIRPPTRMTTASTSKESIALSHSEVVEIEQQTEVESIPPNVGQLINSMQHDDNLTLEQRLTTLEVKLIDLEFAIARMQNQTPTDKPKNKKSSTPDITRKHSRKQSSGRTRTPTEEKEERPISTGTIRPSTLQRSHTLRTPSSTSLTELHGISVDQYSALVMLLRREQSARRNLEHQVSSLQEDMQHLYKITTGSMGIGTRYPIQSTDSRDLFCRRMDRPRSASPARTDKFGSPYDSDSDWEHPGPNRDDMFRSKWSHKDRIEITGMI